MRNRFPGDCYRCRTRVEKGQGHFERVKGIGWRIQHAACAIEWRKKKLADSRPSAKQEQEPK